MSSRFPGEKTPQQKEKKPKRVLLKEKSQCRRVGTPYRGDRSAIRVRPDGVTLTKTAQKSVVGQKVKKEYKRHLLIPGVSVEMEHKDHRDNVTAKKCQKPCQKKPGGRQFQEENSPGKRRGRKDKHIYKKHRKTVGSKSSKESRE